MKTYDSIKNNNVMLLLHMNEHSGRFKPFMIVNLFCKYLMVQNTRVQNQILSWVLKGSFQMNVFLVLCYSNFDYLCHSSGIMKPGLNAIMGPTGSGKTT